MTLKKMSKGVQVSEGPPDLKPSGKDFPRRNTIISGMSVALVVVEAAMKFGSVITARLAAERDETYFLYREVLLIPEASGLNALLKDGAGVVTHADDILQALSPYVEIEHPIKDAQNEDMEDEV